MKSIFNKKAGLLSLIGGIVVIIVIVVLLLKFL